MNLGFTHLVELGVLVFLLFQVYLLANHYAKSYTSLEVLNQNLEQVVVERTQELTTANTVKDRLLSVMSHDIKSPLNSLRGILQLYKMQAISKEEFGDFAQRIEGDLSKTNLLVENILYWTANQIQGVDVKPEEFDINQVIEENSQLFQTLADNKKITLRNESLKNVIVNADKNILNFVIRNLIANAIKFTTEGGAITILASQSNHKLILRIKDNGIGMDENTIAMLLTTNRNSSTSGTNNEKGTGLVLCREYLQKIGGSITIESSLGKGSTFTISMPAM